MGMPKRSIYDRVMLQTFRESQFCVVTRAQAKECGMKDSTITRMARDGGPWQVLLPGVYLTVTGEVTEEHREMAALLYAGPGSMLTGAAAIRHYQLTSWRPGNIEVLVLDKVRRKSTGFIRLHRTARLPVACQHSGLIRFAPAARAVADTARAMESIGEVRSLVYESVQKRKCTTGDLLEELRHGPTQRCALLRQVLDEALTGVRSVAEKQLQDLIRAGGIPEPRYNARLYTMDGKFIAMVDGWWEEAGTATEVDSVQYHTSIAAQDKDRKTSARLISHGVYPLRFSPFRIRTDRAGVQADIKAALERNHRRVPLPIVAVGPDEHWSPEAAAKLQVRIELAKAAVERSR